MIDAIGWEAPRSGGGASCSTQSRRADESLAATASYGRSWLLLEVAGAWGPSAFRNSSVLAPDLGALIERRAAAEGMRLVAIRRPGRARLRDGPGGPRWRWARVNSTPGGESIEWGEVSDPSGYLTAALEEPGTPSGDIIIAVCAHGRHDECCATRGRSVAALLAERDPDAVWECSHIGGDRFAATMLLFPHGINYGRADTFDARQMVDEYRAGRVVLPGLRGRSAFRFLEQAAQDAARRAFGDLRVGAYEPVHAARAGHQLWEVLLADPPETVRVKLADTVTDVFYSNCAATVPLARPAFAVRAVERLA